jgi:hypothetical protein
MDTDTVAVVLRGATRRTNSANGNPVWTLHTGDGDYVTGADYAIGYEVSNHTGGPGNWVGREVVLTLGKGARVTGWKLAG